MNTLESANLISQKVFNKQYNNCGEFEKRQIVKILSGNVKWRSTEFLVTRKGKIIFITDCSNCGNEAKTPFKPDGIRPVLCKSCYHSETIEGIANFNKVYSPQI